MDFVLFIQALGDHWPSLGVLLVLIAFVCLIAVWRERQGYKRGVRDANKRRDFEFEHMPQVISQDIRERKDREIAEWRGRALTYKEQLSHFRNQYVPAFKVIGTLVEGMAKKADDDVDK